MVRHLTGILQRLALAVAGFFIVFDVRLILIWIVGGLGPIRIQNFTSGPQVFLELPFSSIYFNSIMLVGLLSIPKEIAQELAGLGNGVTPELLLKFAVPLAESLAFFVAIIGLIVWFECRRAKTRRDVLFFYLILLPIVWFLGIWAPAILF
ncbi:MAG: hypothetical protein AAB582_04050 [Patescibacteria group bacterium]